MLFIHDSSAFNTVIPAKLITELNAFGPDTHLCNWILDFLTSILQEVKIGNSMLTLNTGTPQGCVLSPLLYSLFTHDSVAKHCSNTILKFPDDTPTLGLTANGDKTVYRDEIRALSQCDNNICLSVSKSKDIIMDFRRCRRKSMLRYTSTVLWIVSPTSSS